MIYLKKENGKEATDNKFSNFKARSKVCVKHFNVKIIGVCCLWGSEGYLVLKQVIKQTRDVMLIRLEVKLDGYKFHQCVEMPK